VPPEPPAILRQALPKLPVDDVATAVDHYRDVLGDSVSYPWGMRAITVVDPWVNDLGRGHRGRATATPCPAQIIDRW
jgi:hypothetical protein